LGMKGTIMNLKTRYAPYVFAFVIIGAILMSFTLYFRINPVESSVVDPRICGSVFHWILFITSMPAWILGLLLSWIFGLLLSSLVSPTMPGYRILFHACAYVAQIAIYAGLGWLIGFVRQRLFRGKKECPTNKSTVP
jgi:hypothetical protein